MEDGTTACTILVSGTDLFCINVGNVLSLCLSALLQLVLDPLQIYITACIYHAHGTKCCEKGVRKLCSRVLGKQSIESD